MVTLDSHQKKLRKTNDHLISYLNRAMRTLRRSILEMATKIMARTNATFEYESVPTKQRL